MRFGNIMVCFTITVGRKLGYLVRAYMPPNDQPKVHRV